MKVTVVQLTHRRMSLSGLLKTFTPYSTVQMAGGGREGKRKGGGEGRKGRGREVEREGR